jgi:hypothetical protein
MANTTFNTFCPSVPRRKGKADLLSSKTNMANTTFNDENIFCLPCNNTERMNDGPMEMMRTSTKTNMANTTFNDENTFCPTIPRKKGKADLLSTKTNMRIAREIYNKAVFRRGGQLQSAYDKTCTFLFKQYKDKRLALFLANKIERELAIDQTFTPTRKSDEYVITDPKLTKIRDDIAAEMRSLPCYHRSPFLCE